MSSIFSSLQLKMKGLRERARRLGVTYDLDQAWLIEKLSKGRCEATGLKFNYKSRPYLNPYYPTIDRIDSNKGYTYDNCWMVCHMFNIAKAEHDIEVFEYWAKEYVKRYGEITRCKKI
jgi:hypothetical protein